MHSEASYMSDNITLWCILCKERRSPGALLPALMHQPGSTNCGIACYLNFRESWVVWSVSTFSKTVNNSKAGTMSISLFSQ